MADGVQERTLEEVADLHGVSARVYNIGANGQTAGHSTTINIDIVTKTNKSGIGIRIKPGTRNKSVHIPVVVSVSGLEEMVCNDFFAGEDSGVVTATGYGVHNCRNQDLEHDRIHRFFVGKNAKVECVEEHCGEGDGSDKYILNLGTEVYMEESSYMEIEMIQIENTDSTSRTNLAELAVGTKLIIRERLLTRGNQNAESTCTMNLSGEDSNAGVMSRSIAEDTSKQISGPRTVGSAKCSEHTGCDTIIMDGVRIFTIPGLIVNNIDATLIHEAVIDKVAGGQIVKLITLCLIEEGAEAQIANNFLK